MKFKKIVFPILIVSLFASCEIDNYKEPNGGIYGTVIDNTTNAPLQTEQPNGFNIKLFEKGGQMNSPIVSSGKPDGTYENAWIFQNKYKVIATEGAFFPIDTTSVEVGKRTEVNFTVTPFLTVTGVSIQPGSGKIISSYKIARAIVGDKIVERKTLVSKMPTVNNIVFNFKKETDIAAMPDADILTTQFSDEITGLTSGDYYIRVAVRTNNELKKYNYSKVFTVTVF